MPIKKIKLDRFYTQKYKEDEIFFKEVSMERLKHAKLREQNHKFTGRISPSALAFDMCPDKYVWEDAHTFKIQARAEYRDKALEKMDIGKALHELYLKRALTVPGLVYDKTTLPEFVQAVGFNRKDRIKDFNLAMVEKAPSVPVIDKWDMFAGEADIIMNVNGKPVVCDLKFPQEEDEEKWSEKLFPKGIYDLKNFITSQYEAQVCVYAEVYNKYGYTDIPIETVGILFRNPWMLDKKDKTDKDIKSIIEVYLPYDTDRRAKTRTLMAHLYRALKGYLRGIRLDCKYKECKKHGNKH